MFAVTLAEDVLEAFYAEGAGAAAETRAGESYSSSSSGEEGDEGGRGGGRRGSKRGGRGSDISGPVTVVAKVVEALLRRGGVGGGAGVLEMDDGEVEAAAKVGDGERGGGGSGGQVPWTLAQCPRKLVIVEARNNAAC